MKLPSLTCLTKLKYSNTYLHLYLSTYLPTYHLLTNTSSQRYLQFSVNTEPPQGHSGFPFVFVTHFSSMKSEHLHPWSSSVYSLITPCISQFPTSAAISSPTLRPPHPAAASRLTPCPSSLPTPWKPLLLCSRTDACTRLCPRWIPSSLLGPRRSARDHLPGWTPSSYLSRSDAPHLEMSLPRGRAHTAWAQTLHTGCSPGILSYPCSGADTPLWALGAAPTLTRVPTCSAKKEREPFLLLVI